MKKRDVTLVDDSGADTRLTLWGEKAERFVGLNQVCMLLTLKEELLSHKLFTITLCSTRQVVAVKKASVSDWNGKSLSLSFSGSVEENPDIAEAKSLRKWFEDVGRVEVLNRTISRESSFGGASDSGLISLGEMRLDFAGSSRGWEQAKYYNVEAHVSAVAASDNVAYKACDRCNKKLQEAGSSGGLHCPKCGEDRSSSFRYRYLVRTLLADATDSTWASAFDEASTVLFSGVPASDLAPRYNGDPSAYQRALSKLQHSQFRLRLSCRRETYNEETRMKVTVHSAAPVKQGKDRIEYLEREIDKLKQQLNM